VAIRGAESTAGSIPKRSAAIGINDPTVVDQVQIARTVIETVIASGMCAPIRDAKECDDADRQTYHHAGAHFASKDALNIAKLYLTKRETATIVVTVCDPALPPVPISRGMKNASATTAASSSS
jgi:hypothetical protein